MKHAVLALALTAVFACASTPPTVATEAIDWEAVAATRTPRILTHEADGGEKARPIWLVVLDGRGYIRTSQTSWLADIAGDANVMLRVGDVAYPLRAAPVVERSLRHKISQGFREKYGVFDFLIHPWGAPAANVLVLVER
jgi:hypothetical protein